MGYYYLIAKKKKQINDRLGIHQITAYYKGPINFLLLCFTKVI